MKRYVAVLEPPILIDVLLHSKLRLALQNNDTDAFLAILTEVNCSDTLTELGERPIHLACQFPSDIRALDILLTMAVDPNAFTETLETPLHYCVAKGNLDGIKKLLAQPNIDPYRLDIYGRSPLRLACEMMGDLRPDGLPMVKALLDRGLRHSSVNKDNDTLTIAFFAYMNGSKEAIALISDQILYPRVDHIPLLRVLDFCNDRVLKIHTEQVPVSASLPSLLAFTDRDGQNVFHRIAKNGYVSGLTFVLERATDLGIDCISQLNAVDNARCKPIDYAAESGNVAVLQKFLNAGVSLDKGASAEDPLRIALWFGHVDAFRYLLAPTLLTGISDSDIRASAGRFWTIISSDARKVEGVERAAVLFPTEPSEFKNMTTMIAINRLKIEASKKEELLKYRVQLYGIQKILRLLDGVVDISD